MPRHMFGDIVDPSVKVGSKQGATVAISIVVHTVIILAMVIIPLMAADILPTPAGAMAAFVGAPPPPRGGSWLCDEGYCFRYRATSRQGLDTLTSTNHVGFRCVSDQPAPAK